MKHPARWIALTVGVVVAALAVVLALQVGNDPRAERNKSTLLGKRAPSFDLATVSGGKVTARGLEGKAVIVNFWNSWCIPCKQEESALKTFWSRHKDDSNVAMVGIVRDDTPGDARRYARNHGMNWTIALDPGSQAALDFATRGQPETYAVSPDGLITGSQYGPVSVGNLETMLASTKSTPQ